MDSNAGTSRYNVSLASMADAYSIRESLQGALQDVIRNCGFVDVYVEAMVRELVGLLAAYREEDLLLFPEVYVFASSDGLTALAPSSAPVTIGTAKLAGESAAEIIKVCAPLAVGGWAVFLVRDQDQFRYGLFRALRHSLATSAEESMGGLGKDVPAILIRNRGHLVVEIRSTAGDRFTAALTTTTAKPSPLEQDIDCFASAATSALADANNFTSYLRRLLIGILQQCHGTLLAVILHPGDGEKHATLTDGVWPDPYIGLADLYAKARSVRNDDSLADLYAAEALLQGMINSDGVVLFGADGTILAYRVFLKPQDDEVSKLPTQGGGRRRTYELMKLRLATVFEAVFIHSQDGFTGCVRSK